MINAGTITAALHDVIVAADLPGLTSERGQRINFDPSRCPWAGVYPDTTTSAPYALGAGSSRWQSTGAVQCIVQTASFVDDGQAASDELEELVLKICAAVEADLSLGITGLRVVRVDRDYRYVILDDDGGGSIFMPQVSLKFAFEYRSRGQA